MASIYERKNANGSITFRVIIRRKNIRTFCLSFLTYEEAIDWVSSHEENYIKDPESYQQWINDNRLNLCRSREFRRKDND